MSIDQPIEERVDEVVIGLAEEAEVMAVEQLARTDATVRALLDRTRERFVALDETAEPAELPADFWSRVEAALTAPAPDTAPDTSAETNVVPLPDRSPPRGLIWATVGSLAASLILAMLLGWSMLSRVEPTVIAVLLNDQGDAVALVEGSADNTTRITILGGVDVPDGRVMQVWTKPDDDGPPVSLGLLARARGAVLEVQGLPAPGPDQLYEITFEPEGGSPTGLPTGPIHGVGRSAEPS